MARFHSLTSASPLKYTSANYVKNLCCTAKREEKSATKAVFLLYSKVVPPCSKTLPCIGNRRKKWGSQSHIKLVNNIPVYSEQHLWKEMTSACTCSPCPLPCQSSSRILHTSSEKEPVSAGCLLTAGSHSYWKENVKYKSLWKYILF